MAAPIKAYLLVVVVCLLPSLAMATTYTCDGSQSDCQSKVSGAADGDIVVIPNGSFTWATDVAWSNKNITVQGGGIGVTILTLGSTGAFNVTDSTKASFRITGMTFNGGSSGNAMITMDSSAASSSVYGWRVDHIDFSNPAMSNAVYIVGINWGLIDHCTFEGSSFNGVSVYSYLNGDFPVGANGIGAASWGLPLTLGTANAVYIEDSSFSGTGGCCGVNDMEYGARMVFRHNTVSNEYIQSHSARGNNRGGSLSMEIYNNTFAGAGFLRFSLILAGTGVIFNNTISGYADSPANSIWFGDQRASQQSVSAQYFACDGSHVWDGNVEASGWPCLDQIGRGPGTLGSQPTVPFYIWNNGTTSTCATGGACDNASSNISLNGSPVSLATYIQTTAHINGDKDYCVGASMPATCGNNTNGYSPFTYPHPLQGPFGSSLTSGNTFTGGVKIQ